MRPNLPALPHKLLLLLLSAAFVPCFAQPVLNRNITMNVSSQRLGSVLQMMEDRGKFNFSYNSNLIPKDSLVTMHVANETVKGALDKLLSNRFEYREAENFVILRYAPSQLSLVTEKFLNENQESNISGYIVNEHSGQKLANASVYSKRTLESAITDASGHFEIKVKNENQPVTLTVSKENYKDTTITFLSDVKVYDESKNRGNSNNKGNKPFRYLINDSSKLENSALGRLFISSKQKIQSINLGGLITQAPFQASLVPGLSTHGSLSGHVVNSVSLNLVGGYNAGVNGFELGIFNLDRSDVRSFQLGVAFNTVGGSVSGIQIAGGFNSIYTNVSGIQIGGGFNYVQGNASGLQLALGFNRADKLNGVQAAAMNIAAGNASGIQFGELNIANKKFSGIQMGGLFNYAQNLRGIQLGFINASDTSSGLSIGFLNFVKTGYHKLVVNTNETVDANVLYKTGTRWLYNIVVAGANLSGKKKLYEAGIGYGNELSIFNFLSFNTELTSRYLYQGNGRYLNLLYRLDGGFNFKLGHTLSIMAGPSLNLYYNQQKNAVNGYAFVIDEPNHHSSGNQNYSRWIGWTIGITIF